MAIKLTGSPSLAWTNFNPFNFTIRLPTFNLELKASSIDLEKNKKACIQYYDNKNTINGQIDKRTKVKKTNKVNNANRQNIHEHAGKLADFEKLPAYRSVHMYLQTYRCVFFIFVFSLNFNLMAKCHWSTEPHDQGRRSAL